MTPKRSFLENMVFMAPFPAAVCHAGMAIGVALADSPRGHFSGGT